MPIDHKSELNRLVSNSVMRQESQMLAEQTKHEKMRADNKEFGLTIAQSFVEAGVPKNRKGYWVLTMRDPSTYGSKYRTYSVTKDGDFRYTDGGEVLTRDDYSQREVYRGLLSVAAFKISETVMARKKGILPETPEEPKTWFQEKWDEFIAHGKRRYWW